MAKYQGMQWRAITKRKAEYIGMAASVAGGFIAVDGDRLGRHSAPKLPDYPDDLDYQQYEQERDTLREFGAVRIAGGDYAWVDEGSRDVSWAGGYLVMAVPDDTGFADNGWSIPVELVESWLKANPQYANQPTQTKTRTLPP